MVKLNYIKMIAFFKSIWNGILGISFEIMLAFLFLFIGFVVCTIWWGIFLR